MRRRATHKGRSSPHNKTDVQETQVLLVGLLQGEPGVAIIDSDVTFPPLGEAMGGFVGLYCATASPPMRPYGP